MEKKKSASHAQVMHVMEIRKWYIKMKRHLCTLGFLLLMTSTAFPGGKSTKDNSAGLNKTFKSDHFELTYPKEWKLSESKFDENIDLYVPNDKISGGMSVELLDKRDEEPIGKWVDGFFSAKKDQIVHKQEIKVSGDKAILVHTMYGENHQYVDDLSSRNSIWSAHLFCGNSIVELAYTERLSKEERDKARKLTLPPASFQKLIDGFKCK